MRQRKSQLKYELTGKGMVNGAPLTTYLARPFGNRSLRMRPGLTDWTEPELDAVRMGFGLTFM